MQAQRETGTAQGARASGPGRWRDPPPRLRRAIAATLAALVLAAWAPHDAQAPASARYHGLLLDGLREHASWCKKEQLYAQRAQVFRLLLLVAPDDAGARRELGYRRKRGVWEPPARPREPRDLGDVPPARVAAHLAESLGPFEEAVYALLADESLPGNERHAIEEDLLRFDPANEVVRRARGEVEVDGRWLLGETVRGAARRDELRRALVAARADTEVEPVEPTAQELAFGLPFQVLGAGGARILFTTDAAEARELAAALAAMRAALRSCLGLEGSLPEGCRIFLVRRDERDRFLAAHPAVDDALRKSLARGPGGGIRGTTDWVHWGTDAALRRDGLVRIAIGWSLVSELHVSVATPWVYEGFGLYLSDAIVGSHTTWFVPRLDLSDVEAARLQKRLYQPETSWMKEAQALLSGERPPSLEALFARDATGLAVGELAAAYALAGFLVEGHARETPAVLRAVGAGTGAAAALREVLEIDVQTLTLRLGRWLDEREGVESVLVAGHTPEQARAAWEELRPQARSAVVARFRALLDEQPPARWSRLGELLHAREAAVAAAVAPRDAPIFDGRKHTPTQPVTRRVLDRDDRRTVAVYRQVFREPDPRALRTAWRYDWSSGELVRLAPGLEDDALFANALDGYPPDLDLGMALVTQALDGGHERASLTALGHAYADREGNVFPGVTLYDAWHANILMEMPDIDVLGVIHDALGDWETWKEPVEDQEKDAIYGRVAGLFRNAREYRELRETIAECYLVGSPVPRPGYASAITNYHALWADADEDVAGLASRLPDGAGSTRFIASWVERCKAQGSVYQAGVERQARLDADAELVRTAMLAALEQEGAFRR